MKKCFSNIHFRRKSLSYARFVRASLELITQLRFEPSRNDPFAVAFDAFNCLSFATLLKSMRCHQS